MMPWSVKYFPEKLRQYIHGQIILTILNTFLYVLVMFYKKEINMNNTQIILNRKTLINLRGVVLIERVTAEDRARLSDRTGASISRFEAFQSNVRFIDGKNALVTQSFQEISAKAGNRFVAVRTAPDEKGALQMTHIVPIDAIRHFETVAAADQEAMKARYQDTDPGRIEALKTRIVYLELDPKSIEAGRPSQFRKMFPVDLKDDLEGRQKLDLVGIGHNRFLLASEIAEVADLSEAELQRLSDKYNVRSETNGDLTTTITLRGGDLILSSVRAREITQRIGRAPVPVAQAAGKTAPVAAQR
jgi:hypothetical protein